MFSQIAAGERSANPALRAPSAGVAGLAENAGATGRVLGVFGASGVAAAAGIAVALHQVRAAIEFADEIADSAQKIGISAEALQEYRYAITAVGGEARDADTALTQFTKTLGLAESGLSPKAMKAFSSLGFTQEDLRNFRDADQALNDIIARVAGLSKECERAAVADKIGIAPLIPLAREGAERVADLRQEAKAMGYVLSNEVSQKGSDAADQLAALSQVIKVQLSGIR